MSQQNKKLLQLTSFIIIIVGIGIISAVKWMQSNKGIQSPTQTKDIIQTTVTKDISSKLSTTNALKEIKQINLRGGDAPAQSWIQDLKSLNLPINTNGHFQIDIMLISFTEENIEYVVAHYSLKDLRSGNTVWESGKTFPILKNQEP